MGSINIPSSTASSASNTVKFLKVGTSGGTVYMGEVRVSPSDEEVANMKSKALTLVAWEDTTFTFTPTSGQVLSYSVDGGAYTALPSTGGSVSVSGAQQVSWSGTAVPVVSSATVTAEVNWGIGKFSSTGKYHVEGNVMSLLGSGWSSNVSLQGKSFVFCGLFSGSTTLMSAEFMVLPATTIYSYCYRSMFSTCSGMTAGPELPSLDMYTSCYGYMFNGCKKLIKAPKLPAMVLAKNCYAAMFSGCTSLTVAPELPATTVEEGCYYYMFANTSIKETPKLPATTLAKDCYREMFKNNSSLITASELSATTLGIYCYSYLFSNCTNLKTFEGDLPAKTLTNGCYRYMFNGCGKLEKAPEILAESSVPTSALTFMYNNCTKVNEITCLVSGISASNGVGSFTKGVASTGTFTKNPEMTGWSTGNDGIPTSWTVKNCYGDKKYPLTFIARENCTFKFVANTAFSASSANTVEFSINDGATWAVQPSTGVSVTAGNTVMWRGSCTSNTGDKLDKSGIGNFTSTGKFDVEGNPMSLLYYDNFSGQTTTPGSQRSFARLFSGNTNVVNAENLVIVESSIKSCTHAYMFAGCTSLITTPKLSATTVGTWGYCSMFNGCTSLTEAPDLPATSIPRNGYDSMFKGCTSLVKPPKISATSMPSVSTSTANCASMFAGCTSLTEAPELLIKTLQPQAYQYMFSGCTSLKYVKCLATDISATNCTQGWMEGVATGGTFVKDPEMTGWTRSTSGIPTTWKDSDYLTFVALERTRFRFNYPVAKEATNKLSYSINGGEWVDDLPSTIYTPYLEKGDKIRWKGNCVGYGFYGIGTFEATGNFNAEGNIMSLLYEDDYATQVSLAGKDNIFINLFQDNENLINTSDMILPATTLSMHCYYNMFNGCTSLTTAPVLPATTLSMYCYYYMFNGCTSLTTAPILPATTLPTACYSYMFSGCTSLNYIKAMFTTTPSTSYTRDWVKGVASSGTFVKNSAATWTTTGVNAVPTGWTIQTASS